MGHEMDRRIDALYRTVVVKRGPSPKAKLLSYRPVYCPTLTYGSDPCSDQKNEIALEIG